MTKALRPPRGHDRRTLLKTGSAFAAGVVASPFVSRMDKALAAWPADKPIKVVVSNTPGGPSDITARLIAPMLQEALGGIFIVENRAGGNSNVGILHVARSEPDGYTLHLATTVYGVNVSLYDPPPYNWQTDLVPVAEIASSPSVFAVQPKLGVSTMKEMVALAKKDQTQFNFGVTAMGSTLHLGAELLRMREGLSNVAMVVHSGGGTNVEALLNGSVQAVSSALAPAHPHLVAGTMKGLAILSEKRWYDLPDIPTSKEAGYDDFIFETTTGLMAPGKTPPELIARIEKATIEGLQRPKMQETMLKAGFLIGAKGAKAYGERITREVSQFGDIIRKAGIKPKPM